MPRVCVVCDKLLCKRDGSRAYGHSSFRDFGYASPHLLTPEQRKLHPYQAAVVFLFFNPRVAVANTGHHQYIGMLATLPFAMCEP